MFQLLINIVNCDIFNIPGTRQEHTVIGASIGAVSLCVIAVVVLLLIYRRNHVRKEIIERKYIEHNKLSIIPVHVHNSSPNID